MDRTMGALNPRANHQPRFSGNPGVTTGPRAVTRPQRPDRVGALRAFSILNGLVLLGVVLQGLWAGGFIGDVSGAPWLQLHRFTAYSVVVLALAAAIVAVVTRRRHRVIAVLS